MSGCCPGLAACIAEARVVFGQLVVCGASALSRAGLRHGSMAPSLARGWLAEMQPDVKLI